MNKIKMNKYVLLLFMVVFLILGGCYQYADPNSSFPANIESQNSVISDTFSSVMPEVIEEDPYILNPKQLFEMGTDVYSKGIDFCVNNAKVTKNVSEFPMEKIFYISDGLFTSSGMLSDEYSFLILDMTLTNTNNTECEYYINENQLYNVDKNYCAYFSAYSNELRGFDKNQHTDDSAFKYTFEPNEVLECKGVFVLNEEALQEDIYLALNIDNADALRTTSYIKVYEKE